MILLDTHVLVWALENHPRLSTRAADVVDGAVAQADAAFSAITVWEIAMLVEKGRLALSRDVGIWITEALTLVGSRLMPLEPAIAINSNRLPGRFHADPADRIIVATAHHYGMTLLTADAAILAYAASGYVQAIDAST